VAENTLAFGIVIVVFLVRREARLGDVLEEPERRGGNR